MRHKDRVKLARKLRTRIESKKKTKTSIFDTKAWLARKEAIAKRVERKIELAKKRKEAKNERDKNK